MTAWLFIKGLLGKGFSKVWMYLLAALAFVGTLFMFNRTSRKAGEAKGREEARKEARENNAEMRDDIHDVLGDPNALFRVRDPKGGNGADGTPGA